MTINRRDFIKTQAIATAAATAGISLPVLAAPKEGAAPAGDSKVRWDKAPCRFCGTGCSVLVGVQDGRVVATQGDPDAPVNRGLNCIKGYFLSKIMYGEDRLTRPLGGAARAVAADLDYALLARSYPLTAGVITRIADEAHALARARAATQAELGDVLRSIEAEFRPRLQTVGRRLVTRAKLGDLVLAEETRDTLQEMEATVRLRHRVLDDWGFQRLVHGRGVSALFYGEPGTGKTLAAGVIAAACGLPLYQIDTAQVVSKWVGETEKNLSEVFDAAEPGHVVLLFNEADSLFGKRTSEVKSANDRYANLETNYLLQRLERFSGLAILTTNLGKSIDPAFRRRFAYDVQFSFPSVEMRAELWRRAFPKGAKLAELNFTSLAERFELSGGFIKVAAERSAYVAAARKKSITRDIIVTTVERMYRERGKLTAVGKLES